MEQKWYFAQCGANDPQAWNIELPDSLQYEQIKQVLTHEVGHTLGLEHNFLGSSHYSIDQLRDNDFLSQYSIGSSIMDYVRCNYALRPQETGGYVSANMISGLLNGATVYFRVKMLLKEKRTGPFGIRKNRKIPHYIFRAEWM